MIWDGRIRADARHLPIADESVQCVVTSPPYFGLRRYDVEGPQIGSEATVEEYLTVMVSVFREVWRVLRPDGTLWLNMGDGFANAGGCGAQGSTSQRIGRSNVAAQMRTGSQRQPQGLKAKDLIGMPWMLALALRDDGWYLRSDIVWHKPQCIPESVTDRPTRAHEFIFLLTRSPKYFYDAEAIKEPVSLDTYARYARGLSGKSQYPGNQTIAKSMAHMWEPGVHPKSAEPGSGIRQNSSFSASVKDVVGMRNKRSVWTVPSAAYPEAHYATFPPGLISPCILAGTSAHGCCPTCGGPYSRILEPSAEYSKYLGKGFTDHANDETQGMQQTRGQNHRKNAMRDEGGLQSCADYITTGWKQSCQCPPTPPIPCTVLDPFAGTNTTGMVAETFGRRWIACDLGYQALQAKRMTNVQKEFIK